MAAVGCARYGGGIYSLTSGADGFASLTILDSTITDNSGFQGGGGIRSSSDSGNAFVSIRNSQISNNFSGDNGGGLCNRVKKLEEYPDKSKKSRLWMLSWIIPVAISIVAIVRSL